MSDSLILTAVVDSLYCDYAGHCLLSEMNLLSTAFKKLSLLSFSGCCIKTDSFYATGSSQDETQNCFNTIFIQNHYITEITTIHMQVGVQAEYCVNL